MTLVWSGLPSSLPTSYIASVPCTCTCISLSTIILSDATFIIHIASEELNVHVTCKHIAKYVLPLNHCRLNFCLYNFANDSKFVKFVKLKTREI